jgi:hypothetical protein
VSTYFFRILRYHPQRKTWERYSYRLAFGNYSSPSLFHDEARNQLIAMFEWYALPRAALDRSKWGYLVVDLGWPRETLPSLYSVAEQRALVEDIFEKARFLSICKAEKEGDAGYSGIAYDPRDGMFILSRDRDHEGLLHLYGPRAEDDAFFFKTPAPGLKKSERAYAYFDPVRRLLIQVRLALGTQSDIHLFGLGSLRHAYIRASFLKLTCNGATPVRVNSERLAAVVETFGVPPSLIWRILIRKLLVADGMGRVISFRLPVSADFFTAEEVAEYKIDAAKLASMVPSRMLSVLFGADHPFSAWYWRRLVEGL